MRPLLLSLLVSICVVSNGSGWFIHQNPSLETILANLRPKAGDSALLIGFDTDVSKDSESYSQYYDYNEKEATKPPTNRTVLLTRVNGTIKFQKSMDFIASPQRHGFVFMGMARYFEPKPRLHNDYLSEFDKPDSNTKLFGFDYTRIWMTTSLNNIDRAKHGAVTRTKAEVNSQFRKAKEKEWEQNISDYQRISYVTDGLLVRNGYWSKIIGGAAFFEAEERNSIVAIRPDGKHLTLASFFSKKQIVSSFKNAFDQDYRFGPDSKYNDMDAFWNQWKEQLNTPGAQTFTLERSKGHTVLSGLILVPGNNYRSFMASAEFGQAPRQLVRYDNPAIDFDALKQLYPNLVDYYVSPNEDTLILLTDKEFIGIDVASRTEILRQLHNLAFNKVVMVDWAVGTHVDRWQRDLSQNGDRK